MINQYASICILNKKDVPLHHQKESEPIMEDKKKINNNGHPYVDLGLPSGTLWAACNVGAKKSTDYGKYFQWGDTKGYTVEQVGKRKGKKAFNWADYKFSIDGSDTSFSKYATEGAALELEDDAAHVNMGGDWHIPTPEQIKELIDNTIARWTIFDGVGGYLFTSKKDKAKSIFFPTADQAWNGENFGCEYYGYVWSSMLALDYVNLVQSLGFDANGAYLGDIYFRDNGFPVRGVI